MKLDYESLTISEKLLFKLLLNRGGVYQRAYLTETERMAGDTLVKRGWLGLDKQPFVYNGRRIKRLAYSLTNAAHAWVDAHDSEVRS